MRRFAWFLLVVALGCQEPDPPSGPPASPTPGRVHALLLNGGGGKAQNFQSHLLHVQHLYAQLEQAGVDPSRITVLSGDGEDPDPDVAVRDQAPPGDGWLLDGTRLETPLRPPVVYVNTTVEDARVRPATRAALEDWFFHDGRALVPGDTLLLYVTDHGTKNADDVADNRITLYGTDQAISVSELSALLRQLAPGVRVVAVMSQCYSGAFAAIPMADAGSDRPPGSFCGYFSVTADRPAYGCYPENRGRENVGHSFHFLETFAHTGSLAAAHDDVLVADATPDVPLRTSDVALEDLLHRAADAAAVDFQTFADDLLARAWENRAAWEAEIRLLDRIGAAYGMFSPRSLAELETERTHVDEMAEQLQTHARAWQEARASLARAFLDRFLAARPAWADRVAPETLARLGSTERVALAAQLQHDMLAALDDDPATRERFEVLRDHARLARQLAYRMDVRQGVVLRLRALLVDVAARMHLAMHGSARERELAEALRACEDLRLPPGPVAPGTELVRADPFPVLADDVALADRVLPAWMGIQFRQARDQLRRTEALGEGASTVMMVYDDSPAHAAGLREGDVVLGPPGSPFSERDQIREWVMRSPPDVPAPLEVLRDGRHEVVTLVPARMPRKWPSLPGPPKVGSAAPALRVEPYRGGVPTSLAGGEPHLLFFWATWCTICKAAVPDLLEYARERSTPIIAITDETPAELDPFFAEWHDAFPALVALDPNRAMHRAYGVSGTPTFVLVDASGTVRGYQTGYTKKRGLQLDADATATAQPSP